MSNIQYLFSKLMYTELAEFFGELKNYDYAIVKGEPLSKIIYGEFHIRQSTDIDILIPKPNIKKVGVLLEKYGFKQKKLSRQEQIVTSLFSHQTTPYVKKTDIANLTVDINYELFWGEFEGRRGSIEEFLSDTIEMEFYGVRVKTLPPMKAMMQLILHHYKDMNSIFLLATRKSIKYEMFKDVYYLLKNNLDSIILDDFCAICEKYEIVPYVFYVLCYTGQIFEDETLKQYIEAFRTSKGQELLDCYGLCDKERKKWKYDFKTRLECVDLYDLIKDDLTDRDRDKIRLNKRVFMEEFE